MTTISLGAAGQRCCGASRPESWRAARNAATPTYTSWSAATAETIPTWTTASSHPAFSRSAGPTRSRRASRRMRGTSRAITGGRRRLVTPHGVIAALLTRLDDPPGDRCLANEAMTQQRWELDMATATGAMDASTRHRCGAGTWSGSRRTCWPQLRPVRLAGTGRCLDLNDFDETCPGRSSMT